MSCQCVNTVDGDNSTQLKTSSMDALDKAAAVMRKYGHASNNQQMGMRWAVGCVALEITQRCNLDCTLCYLSEYSEAVHDIPLQLVLERIDKIHESYGENTDVQVTGGDPTLRKRDELITIIRYIRDKGMRSTLMTNGIKATRELLQELSHAGLNDVAFHVDITQERKGYTTEASLNSIRSEYIDRCKGLGLSVVFNTTMHAENIAELPLLIQFFVQHAHAIRTVSFQLQADTGRGIEGSRDSQINIDNIWKTIEQTCATKINYKAIRVGHPHCNRYGMAAITNNHVYNLFDDTDFCGRMQMATRNLVADRNKAWKTFASVSLWALTHPTLGLEVLSQAWVKLKQMSADLVHSRGRVSSLSFFVHNFMDANNLEQERIESCVFMNMTPDGPVAMCEFNARRDDYILKGVPLKTESTVMFWDPMAGRSSADRPKNDTEKSALVIPKKKLRGRFKRVRD